MSYKSIERYLVPLHQDIQELPTDRVIHVELGHQALRVWLERDPRNLVTRPVKVIKDSQGNFLKQRIPEGAVHLGTASTPDTELSLGASWHLYDMSKVHNTAFPKEPEKEEETVELANGETVPKRLVEALDRYDIIWPGATLPQARAAIVRVILKELKLMNLENPS